MLPKTNTERLKGILRHLTQTSQQDDTIQPVACSMTPRLPLRIDTKAELARERSRASFPIKELTIFLDGTAKYTEFKSLVAQQIEYDPVLCETEINRPDLTRPEFRERTMRKIKHVTDLWMAMKSNTDKDEVQEVKFTSGLEKNFSDAFWEVMSMSDTSWATRFGVHFGLFLPTIIGQGTEEQRKVYEDLAMTLRITGCYAMTELGHGSNVAGLETTATYDKNTQEFVIHTPSLTATKWWIGGAAHTASHAIVFAQLIIDEKNHGVHSFVVQLRNLEDGSPRPGVTIGDCGAKMGRNGLDNGWIQFNNVRISRENMLMRWSSVSPSGEFVKPPRKQLAYGALIGGRVNMVKDSSDFMKKALTIAIRYSAIRRQFTDEPSDELEKQILNYQTHQHRLFPLLAATFGTHFTASILKDRYTTMQADLNEENLSSLAGVHATSAGLKAFITWWASQGLETCRQCLGGHGYSSYTGISELLGDFAVMCTWEGDNTVLAQQLARYLIKQLRRGIKKKKIIGFESYIGNSARILSSFFTADNFEIEELLKAHEYVAVKLLVETEKRLHYLRIQYGNKVKAWQDCIVDLVESARAHVNYFISHCFVEAVKQAPPAIKPILTQLCLLHSLTLIEQNLATLLRESYLKSFHVDYVQNKIRELYKTIREQAVPLVDSFNLPDVIVNSPFGRYDGDVYEEYFKVVNNAPTATGNPPYYDELVKPLHHRPLDEQE